MSDAALASWNPGKAKEAILDFVFRVTTTGPDFVAPADRIAAFDNDGTLWVEQPLPPQFDFVFRTWGEEVRSRSVAGRPAAVQRLDREGPRLLPGRRDAGPRGGRAPARRPSPAPGPGRRPTSSRRRCGTGWRPSSSPSSAVSYQDLVYEPMLELFDLLKAQRVPRVRLLRWWPGLHAGLRRGDLGDLQGERDRLRRGVRLRRRPDRARRTILGGLTLGPGKPEHIFARTGRLPVFAGGNADVDIEMLESGPVRPADQPRRRRPGVRLHRRRPRRPWPGPTSWAGPSSA